MEIRKQVALVACEARKREFLFWIRQNAQKLSLHELYIYGFGRELLFEDQGLLIEHNGQAVIDGLQDIKRLIVQGKFDIILTFWDPMSTDVCDVDIESLIHMAALYNLAIATNQASADFMVASTLFEQTYRPMEKEYSNYVQRILNYSGAETIRLDQADNIVVIT